MWRSIKSSSQIRSWPSVWSNSLVEKKFFIISVESTLLTLIKLSDQEETKIDEVLCKLGADLDGRFSSVRTAETNLGNFLCDVMLAALQADCAILNAGTVRSNVKHSKGEFKLRVSSGQFLPFSVG